MTPAEWFAEDLEEGGELPLLIARGSYYAWAIGKGMRLSQTQRDDGKRWLRAQGYKVKRRERWSAFIGVQLRGPFEEPRPVGGVTPTGMGDPARALMALKGMASPRDLDIAYLQLTGARAYLCSGCGKVTRHESRRHVGC